MPVYERQGGTNWVKIIVIAGIIGLVLVGGCVAVLAVIGTRIFKETFVQIEQTTDANGAPVFSTEHFTLTALPDWTLHNDDPMPILEHGPTKASVMVMSFNFDTDGSSPTDSSAPASATNAPAAPDTSGAAPPAAPDAVGTASPDEPVIGGRRATITRDTGAQTVSVLLKGPYGHQVTFTLTQGDPLPEAEKALIALLNTIQWKPEATGGQ